jgi:RHS repeat-associated protein
MPNCEQDFSSFTVPSPVFFDIVSNFTHEVKFRNVITEYTTTYTYGFNGKEKDAEVYNVDGTEYDYGMRIYDPRIGRFLSVDPLTKKYAYYTPYQFAGNKPIVFIDRDGEEEARTDEKLNALLRPFTAYIVNKNKSKAVDAAHKSGLPDARDGQWDAFRHAYWNTLNARDLGEKSSEFFPTLHETGSSSADPKSPEYDPVATQMDLFNNAVGRKIGAANPNATDAQLGELVKKALKSGELKVIKIEDVKTPTGEEVRTPVNKEGKPIENNSEKILISSAPETQYSGAATPIKGNYGEKKSAEYKDQDNLPPK